MTCVCFVSVWVFFGWVPWKWDSAQSNTRIGYIFININNKHLLIV